MAATKTKGKSPKSWLRWLGPGLITGASDDDPSGIATYSQVGAGYGYTLLWTMLFSYPLMCAVQEISARIGRVTGRGIAGNIQRHYSAGLLYPIVFLLVLANTFNIGADIGAMGESLKLLAGGNAQFYSMAFAALCILLEIFVPYSEYSIYLKWLTPVLFSYFATVLVVNVDWGHALKSAILPHFGKSRDYWATFTALLGTTISPYLFFWQASEETEELRAAPLDHALKSAPEQASKQFSRIRIDTYAGMLLSNFIGFTIILAAAATLNAKGVHQINTAAEAAEALRPLAGQLAFMLFAAGIVGTGLLAVPVLAGSAAYAVGEAFRWPTGLNRKPLKARGFYAVLASATLVGLALNLPLVETRIHITPIRALFWSAVINGVVAVPILVVMMLITGNRKLMGRFANSSRTLKFVGWLTTGVMAAAAIGMFLAMTS
jgi:Mn2+/Fe2+ NRAMP family transporter